MNDQEKVERDSIAWHTQHQLMIRGEIYYRYRIRPSSDDKGVWVFERLLKRVGYKLDLDQNEELAKFGEEAFRGIELIYKAAFESPANPGNRLLEVMKEVLK